MPLPFHAPWLLLGLAALAIPPLIHLLNRRRHDIVDWGAMQFLQVSDATRRRVWLEELLLMLVRMGLLAVLCLALAGPFLDVKLPAAFAGRPPRDVVLVIDGSASMGAADEEGVSAFARAVAWAENYLDGAQPGDGLSVLLARERAVSVSGELSADAARARRLLAGLPAPAGTCNWADALRAAFALLSPGQNGQREVILLSDNQAFGVGDPASLFRWELLAGELGLSRPAPMDRPRPRIVFIDMASGRGGALPNYAVAPLASNRPVAVAGREVRFQGALVVSGQETYAPPHRIRLEVDGKHVRDLPAPAAGAAVPRDGRIPFSFAYRFADHGSHLVSVIIEPDPPPAERPPGYTPRDRVPGDDRQDLSVEVIPTLPVLIIDGEPSGAVPPSLASDFLRDALSPALDRTPAVKARVVTVNGFTPEMLTPAPRAVILHDVRRLSPEQADALSGYLDAGGGVLISPGERADAEWYNAALYRGGTGWLPARLDGLAGDEAKVKEWGRPEPPFQHPALAVFRDVALGGLADARFPRWWRLTTAGKNAAGVPGAHLAAPAGKSPLLVERPLPAGRVILSAVPFDASWGGNLPELSSFVPLVHELVYYLAGARSAEYNLAPGQPIRFPADGDAGQYTLTTPAGEARPLSLVPGEAGTLLVQKVEGPSGPAFAYDGARESGVYTLRTPAGASVHYVIPADAREADLSPLTKEMIHKVGRLTGMRFAGPDDGSLSDQTEDGTRRQDLWLYLLLGLVGLLCVEVWMTRRLVMNR